MKSVDWKIENKEIVQEKTHPVRTKKANKVFVTAQPEVDNELTRLIRNGGWLLTEIAAQLGGKSIDRGYAKLNHPWARMSLEDVFFISYLLDVPYGVVWGCCYSRDEHNLARNLGKGKAQSIIKKLTDKRDAKILNDNYDSW